MPNEIEVITMSGILHVYITSIVIIIANLFILKHIHLYDTVNASSFVRRIELATLLPHCNYCREKSVIGLVCEASSDTPAIYLIRDNNGNIKRSLCSQHINWYPTYNLLDQVCGSVLSATHLHLCYLSIIGRVAQRSNTCALT